MKQILVLIVLIAFNVGVVTSSAFAFECPMMSGVMADAGMDGEMPCHDPQEQQQKPQCDGPCLCLHLSISQAQLLSDSSIIIAAVNGNEIYAMTDSQVHSLSPLPLFKPPILIS